MKKILFLMLVIFALSFTVVHAQICDKAVIGPTNDVIDPYEIDCGDADGFCPEIYGDWSTCTQNAYNGKCTANPDPDCPGYGALNLVVPPFVEPRGKDPSSNIDLLSTVIGSVYNGVNNGILSLTDSIYTPLESTTCTGDPCTNKFIQPAPFDGGAIYTYALQFVNFGDSASILPAQGWTTPLIIIGELHKHGQGSGATIAKDEYGLYSDVRKKINIKVTASSELGIEKMSLFLYREDPIEPPGSGIFVPANPYVVNCGDCSADPDNCNKIGEINISSNPQSTYEYVFPTNFEDFSFDTTICNNGKYRVIAKAEDSRGSVAEGDSQPLEFTLTNPGAPLPIEKPSELLKLVVVKVKTWILT